MEKFNSGYSQIPNPMDDAQKALLEINDRIMKLEPKENLTSQEKEELTVLITQREYAATLVASLSSAIQTKLNKGGSDKFQDTKDY